LATDDDNIDHNVYYQSNVAVPEVNVEGVIPNESITNSFVDGRIYVKGNDSQSYLLGKSSSLSLLSLLSLS
jgi:hypothetical protein